MMMKMKIEVIAQAVHDGAYIPPIESKWLLGRIAVLEAALREYEVDHGHFITCGGRMLPPGDSCSGTCKQSRAALSDTGKGCEHEFTGPPGAYAGQWSRCLKCNQMTLRPTGAAWLPPDKVRQARGAVSMIDASPGGSLNAKFKAEALDALEVSDG